MYLLFFDLLGVKYLWKKYGVDGVKSANKQIKDLVKDVVTAEKDIVIIDGGIETDSVALLFKSPVNAIRFGVALYQKAFDLVKKDEFRLWFRGVITTFDGTALRNGINGSEKLDKVTIVEYSDELLEAIAVEKSGVKGMRLLIESNILLDPSILKIFKVKVNGKSIGLFNKLTFSPYVGERLVPYQDILWMLSVDDVWAKRQIAMSSRLRFAAQNEEEFYHAAATQLLFQECNAILGSKKTK